MKKNYDRVLVAKRLAIGAHKGQKRLDGSDYICHPKRVVKILRDYYGNIKSEEHDNVFCAAWLHDVMEDCGVRYELIHSVFGEEVADLVLALTKPKDVPKPDYILSFYNKPQLVKVIKLADRLDNVSDVVNSGRKSFAARYLEESKQLLHVIGRDVAPLLYDKIQEELKKIEEYLKEV